MSPHILNTPVANPIRTLLQIADDGTIPGRKITINGATLQSIDAGNVMPGIIRYAFNNQPIEITDAQANPANDGAVVIITGTGGFRLTITGVPVTCMLTLVEGNVQAIFQYTVIGSTPPPVPWKFSNSFPDLPTDLNVSQPDSTPTSPLDELVMTNAQFLVTTCEQTFENQDLIAGINFRANLSPTGILSVFETLVGGSGDLKLQGTIYLPYDFIVTPPLKPEEFPWEMEGTVPGINLKAGLAAGAFQLGGMSFTADHFRVYSAASTEWFGKNSTFETTVAYSGKFEIPSAKTEIDVTVVTPPDTNAAQLYADFENSPIGNFSELADLLGIDNVLSSFPDAIQKGDLGGLGIQRASVTIGFDKGLDVRAASITVGMPKLDWNIWPGHFEVQSVSATLTVQNPFDPATRAIDILVKGSMEVQGVPVNIYAQKGTGFTIMASVAERFDVPLSSFMSTYAPGIPEVSDLSIDNLELTVSPGNYYSVMLLMAQQPKPWTIPLGVTELTFSNVGLFLLKPASGDLSGSFYGTAQIAGVTLTSSYNIPGDVIIRGDFPSVSLSEIVSFFIQQPINVPSGFNLTFTQSFIMLVKKGNDYNMQLGTVIDKIGSLAFVLQKGAGGWGVAVGLQIEVDQLGNLSGGVSDSVNAFTSWFPFQTFTLAISTLNDQTFTFPGFEQFDQAALGKSKIKLPAIARGIQPGFFLYTSTVFTKKNKILGALIDLLKIPEGTQLDGFLAYLTEKKQFQLGVSLTTFLTPVEDVNQRTCAGALGYKNTCLTGTIMVLTGGPDGFAFGLAASLKTLLEDNELDFDVLLTVVGNGVFVSGTLKVEKPLTFGPLQLGGVALELGISFEGLPSFGFAAELMVDNLFDSTLAVMINTANPAESMIAGALSNLTLGDVVDKLVGVTNEELPAPIKSALDEVSIKGTTAGAFTVPKGASATQLEDALNNFKGDVIQSDFMNYGKQASFPSTSDGMMIFNDSKNGKWYITEKAGAGSSSTVTHWQLIKNSSQEIEVSREAQFYFVPSPSGVSIGTFYYPQGMKISGRIQFLLFKLDTDIDIIINKGIRVDAQMDKISLVSDNFFSIAAEQGAGGPQVSISTFTQPGAPEKFQKPHFFVNGKLTLLGASQGIFVDINESGANLEVTGSSLGGVFNGKLSGSFTAENLSVTGNINVGIGSIDLGKLGTWNINTGVYAASKIYADLQNGNFGATFTAGFELAGTQYSLGDIRLDVNVGKLADLAGICWQAVKDFLIKLFTDPKYWAEMAAKVLGWVEDRITGVLTSVFGLSSSEAKAIVSAISAFCPIVTAVSILGK
ncbi:hypothetical protein FAM09_16770 [Niastella caeni]|uniref:Uncharacterized protein n=1 Tax=Niastella caeni TaxID=2569763 RepID=A0A4S8HS24_9BACT|nr:hypothetical protein [Niastella caeni]THU38328.1 hypothetical protein FAM09_16770 [Niastella caeni]